jgi:hypothetical protein
MEVRVMQAVYGIYDGKVVRLLEPIQVESPFRVTVTFLEPIERDTATTDEDNLERFIGMWTDFTPEEDRVFQTILEERASYFAGREIELAKSTAVAKPEPVNGFDDEKRSHPGGKPRELGAEALSEEEFLAILISTGIKGKPAAGIAKEIVEWFGSLAEMANVPKERTEDYGQAT